MSLRFHHHLLLLVLVFQSFGRFTIFFSSSVSTLTSCRTLFFLFDCWSFLKASFCSVYLHLCICINMYIHRQNINMKMPSNYYKMLKNSQHSELLEMRLCVSHAFKLRINASLVYYYFPVFHQKQHAPFRRDRTCSSTLLFSLAKLFLLLLPL